MCGVSELSRHGAGMGRLRGFHGDRSGQISMLTVLVAVILASLLGLVVSTGDQVTQKLEMQNAVDAAALSGGIWIARWDERGVGLQSAAEPTDGRGHSAAGDWIRHWKASSPCWIGASLGSPFACPTAPCCTPPMSLIALF